MSCCWSINNERVMFTTPYKTDYTSSMYIWEQKVEKCMFVPTAPYAPHEVSKLYIPQIDFILQDTRSTLTLLLTPGTITSAWYLEGSTN